MIIKEIVTGLINILQYKELQVREDTVIIEDGKELSRTYFRYSLVPGDDVSDKPQLIKDLAGLLWTPEVIVAWQTRQAELQSKMPPLVPGL